MRKSHLLAVVAAGVVLVACLLSMTLSGSDAAAQSPVRQPARPQPAPARIALLDISYIFNNHVRLKAMMDEMKQDVQAAETWAKNERDAITKLAEQMRTYRQGSPEYKTREEAAAQRQADLAIKVQQRKREFLQREARMYYNTYLEVQQEVNYYCAANNVAIVLRFSREGADAENPETVLPFINKPVITYAKDLDITDLILAQLNRRPAGANTSPVGTRPRPGVQFN